ncbi:MAG: hypothetical protein QOD10_4857 [Mycobacterium sp.]|nr:hypothetical protein [Mycobacterium sp.]
MGSAPATPNWPTERGRYSGVLLQFGQSRADLLGVALTTGDPLADAVVEEIHAGGRDVRHQLDSGIRHGLASLDAPPPAVAALLASTENLPDYADDDVLDNASMPFFTMPNPVHLVSLSAGALIRVYESPSISKVLATTGRLVEGADRRIRETGKWVATVMLPGGLRPGGPGYVATLQVRMLHAHMRRFARAHGFDEGAYGAPINQVDLARTWMDFTVTTLNAEQAMGFGLTSAETATLYRYWWVVAHVLGIDPNLVEGIQTNEQAARADELYQAVTGPLIAESVTLAKATLDSITDMLTEALSVPDALGNKGLHSVARRFHGTAVADELQIGEDKVADAAIAAAINGIRARRLKLRRNPTKWSAEQVKNLEAAHALLGDADNALYETDRSETESRHAEPTPA